MRNRNATKYFPNKQVLFQYFEFSLWHSQGRIVTWDPPGNKIAVRSAKNFFCSRVGLKFSQVEMFWDQPWMFQGQYTVQVAPQTAPYGLLLQTE